jgi:hypothetical protein
MHNLWLQERFVCLQRGAVLQDLATLLDLVASPPLSPHAITTMRALLSYARARGNMKHTVAVLARAAVAARVPAAALVAPAEGATAGLGPPQASGAVVTPAAGSGTSFVQSVLAEATSEVRRRVFAAGAAATQAAGPVINCVQCAAAGTTSVVYGCIGAVSERWTSGVGAGRVAGQAMGPLLAFVDPALEARFAMYFYHHHCQTFWMIVSASLNL